ncbi:MAG: HAD-IC family P-type ATPase, partial [Phyllobacteriaceae bacterium]|nr:HAD-IC family P-type ATPase [Phyllobacteriaceae bacterium]
MDPRSNTPGGDGLTDAEALARFVADGPNELPDPERRSRLRILFDALSEPMSALLVGGGVLYFLLGDTTEAIVLFLFTTLSISITVVQEARTENILDTLRDLTAPTALVIRGGERRRIPAREVVRGDLVEVREGDRVPADGRLTEARGLGVDESLLTGESVPVSKQVGGAAPGYADAEVGEVKAGTLVVRGSGLAVVTAIGEASEIGRIGRSLRLLEPEAPRLRAQTRRVVTVFAIVAAVVSSGAVGLFVLLRGGWLEGLLSGIALGMSLLPEEFPLVLTVFVAMGAWRISKVRVLARRGDAIETLGATTVLCTDKTGTLTQNRMTVVDSYGDGALLARAAALCSDAQISRGGQIVGEPTENALVAFALKQGADKNVLTKEYPRVGEAPFDS